MLTGSIPPTGIPLPFISDYEEKYNSKEFDVYWDNNVKQIQTVSGVKTFRLSKIAKTSYNDYKIKIFSDGNLKEKITDKIDIIQKINLLYWGLMQKQIFKQYR